MPAKDRKYRCFAGDHHCFVVHFNLRETAPLFFMGCRRGCPVRCRKQRLPAGLVNAGKLQSLADREPAVFRNPHLYLGRTRTDIHRRFRWPRFRRWTPALDSPRKGLPIADRLHSAAPARPHNLPTGNPSFQRARPSEWHWQSLGSHADYSSWDRTRDRAGSRRSCRRRA